MASRHALRCLSSARVSFGRLSPLVTRGLFQKNVTSTQHLSIMTRIISSNFHTSSVKFSEHVFDIQSEEDFKDKVLESDKPIVVDFHATWCGPCKLLGPTLELVIRENKGEVLMAKIDIDQNQDLAISHGVNVVPTVLLMKDGMVIDKFVGNKEFDEVDKLVAKLLQK